MPTPDPENIPMRWPRPRGFSPSIAGTPVCWDVVAARNTFVEPTEEPQMFMATIEVRGGPGETLLAPYGSLFMSWPYSFFPFAVIPDVKDIEVPASVPPGTRLVLQELALDLYDGAGNFSNAVGVVIE